ncbi:MAG: InlB B-repeat-containing protein [Roseburia sp.]
MPLYKIWIAILYVLLLLLNDPYFMHAYELQTYGAGETDANSIEGMPHMADWAASPYIHIAYELDGGINDADNPVILTKKELPIILEVPVKEGYNFAGWYTDREYQNKITQINAENAANMVLFAKWTNVIDNHYNVEMYSYNTASILSKNHKELKECSYGFLDDLEIPGMPSTRERDYRNDLIRSVGQCMQGLCFTPKFILVTAYSEELDTPGSLMIFDRKTGEYLVTLGMKEKSHVGGITFDGDNFWICHSDSNTLERISYDYIETIAADAPKCFVDASALSDEYKVKNIPSCITAYGGRLWVATHTKIFGSKMLSYSYDEREDRLTALSSYNIPGKVQGVAFDSNGSVYLSTSYGRSNSSHLKVYHSLVTLDRNPNEPAVKIEMPPCSEGIVIAEEKVYVLFESASRKYFEGTDGNGSSTAPLDKVLEVTMASIW